MVTYSIVATGVFKTGLNSLIRPALIKSTQEICEVIKIKAQETYLNLKKSEPKVPSLIIDSFHIEGFSFGNFDIRGMIYAGAPTAPYAIYVDEGFTTTSKTNKRFIEGYHFMEAGLEEGNKEAPDILNKNFRMILI
jgi:hypothetical protein